MTDVWPFNPMLGCTEELGWNTEIMSSRTGEQRLALLSEPRSVYSYASRLRYEQYSRAKVFAHYNGVLDVYVPTWGEYQRIAGAVGSGDTSLPFSTLYGDWRVGYPVLVWSSDSSYVVVTIATIAADHITITAPVGTAFDRPKVMPLRLATLPEGMTADRIALCQDVSLVFQLRDTLDLSSLYVSPYPQYLSVDVIVNRPFVVEQVSEQIIREANYVDSALGYITVDDIKNYADSVQTLVFMETRNEVWQRRLWLHALRGRRNAFWLPSFNNDFPLATDIVAADTTLTVKSVAPTGYYIDKVVMIELTDNTRYFRVVTGAASAGGGNDSLTIAPLGVNILMTSVRYVSVLTLSRLAADRVLIDHRYTQKSIISVPVTKVPA